MQLVKYLKCFAGDSDLMLFVVARHKPPIWPKAKLLCCIVFLHYFFLCMNLPHTKAHFAALILLSSPSRGVALSLNDPSLPKHIQLEADQ